MFQKKWIVILCLALLMIFQTMQVNVSAAKPPSTKRALIVVDPGYSGFSYQVAQAIAKILRERKIETKVVKIKEFKKENLEKTDLFILGGPTYAHRPSKGVRRFLAQLNSPGINTLLFQTGGIDCAGIAPLQESAQAKGLNVIGIMTITIKQSQHMEAKIRKFLGPIK
jgi:flavodoxin